MSNTDIRQDHSNLQNSSNGWNLENAKKFITELWERFDDEFDYW